LNVHRRMEKMKKDREDKLGQEMTYQLSGWILFIICAVFFIASSLKNHDTLALIASVIFLISCIVFLVPLIKRCQGRPRGDR